MLGARGFVAARLIQMLARRGWDHLPIGSDQVDLTHSQSVDQLLAQTQETDVIVMTSALTPEKGKDRATFYRNVQMAEHLCQFFEKRKCAHFVYISSDAVYAESSKPVTETSPCDPASFYALAHLVRERLLIEQTAKSSVPTLILRPCAVYGPGDTHNSYGPNRFVRTARQTGNITLFGQGEEIRPHLYIDDFVELILLTIQRRSVGILNSVPSEGLPFHQVAGLIIELIQSAKLSYAPRMQPITHRAYDTLALHEAFPGFQFTPLPTGLAKCAEAVSM